MHRVNIHAAKTQFSKLIDEALMGNEVIITKSGKPVVKLVAISKAKPKRVFGVMKGKIKIAKDFDAPLSDEII